MENLNVPIIDVIDDDTELAALEDVFLNLASIVSHRRYARRQRLSGNVVSACDNEYLMDQLYKKLPEWARW